MIAVLLLVCMTAGSGCVFAETNGTGMEQENPINSVISTDKDLVEEPKTNADGAIALCGETGEVLYGKNIDEHLDPLSMTKVLTVYIVMKEIDAGRLTLDTKATATKEDCKVMESKLYLQKGEQMPIRDLIYATLLHSANDAAAVLGSTVSGNKKEFAKRMNEEAKKLGCTNSNFTNANGLIEGGNYSSPHDMALIAQACFQYDFVQEVCQTRRTKLAPTNKYDDEITVTLTNPFFHKHKKLKKPWETYNIKAGKTGTWEYDNASLMEMAEYNGKTIYTVVMNDMLEDRYKDTLRLLNYSRAKLDYYDVLEADTIPADPGTGAVRELSESAPGQYLINKVNQIALHFASHIKTTVLNQDGSVKLEWEPVKDAEGYRIFRSDGADYELVGEVKKGGETAFTDTTVKEDEIYHYYVRAKGLKIMQNLLAQH